MNLSMLPPFSGKTVALPPEVLVFGIAPSDDMATLETRLRVMFTLATPWVLTGPARSLADLDPVVRDRYLHYADLYKSFMRPPSSLLATVSVFATCSSGTLSRGSIGFAPQSMSAFTAAASSCSTKCSRARFVRVGPRASGSRPIAVRHFTRPTTVVLASG